MDQALQLGAHLSTPRLGYSHHGIYVGNGRVVHYAGFKRLFQRGPVEEISLEEFAHGHGFEVKTWAAPKFDGADVVARVRSRIGEDGYRLFTNNCEHFVEWAITGRSRSSQVEALKLRVLAAFGLSRVLGRRAAPIAAQGDALAA